MMRFAFSILTALLCSTFLTQAQSTIVQDDFEGSGTITTWFGDACGMNPAFSNPYSGGINTSATVLEYDDAGGQYANIRFDAAANFDLVTDPSFSLKIYVPSSGITGAQPNQVSLKLQDGTLGMPWITQSEIIKSIVLDQWQTISFDFQNDSYINLDPTSAAPITRTDFNRVVIQVNGENNFDAVRAYIDDVDYNGIVTVAPVYTLVWSDEFDVDGVIDNTNWFHQTLLPSGGSWFNGEIQHYTDRIDNSYVDNGSLFIDAKKETFLDQGVTKQYTSARLNSKFAFTYGRVEIRAKLPTGIGTWPAIWTLGKNINENGAYWDNEGYGTTSWPTCGEIDIMEHWGSNQDYISSATHTPSSFGGTINVGGQVIPGASTGFHTYTLDWTEEKLVFSVDGAVHFTYEPPVRDANTWPFDDEQYILLNVAVLPDIFTGFTSSAMEIDYVRVYQQGCAIPTGLQSTILSSTNATISWNAVDGAMGYQVSGGPVGGLVRTFKTTATSRSIPVLNPSTDYQWQVRTFCDPELSTFSALENFTTPALRTNSEITITPNPSNGTARVFIPGEQECTVELIDLNGRLWSKANIIGSDRETEFHNIPKGMYIVRVLRLEAETHKLLFVN